jgi:hypothetical protein
VNSFAADELWVLKNSAAISKLKLGLKVPIDIGVMSYSIWLIYNVAKYIQMHTDLITSMREIIAEIELLTIETITFGYHDFRGLKGMQ